MGPEDIKIYVPEKNVYVCFFVDFEISAASIFVQWPNFYVSNVIGITTILIIKNTMHIAQVCNSYNINKYLKVNDLVMTWI